MGEPRLLRGGRAQVTPSGSVRVCLCLWLCVCVSLGVFECAEPRSAAVSPRVSRAQRREGSAAAGAALVAPGHPGLKSPQ